MTRADHLALVAAQVEAARSQIAAEERAEKLAEARARRESAPPAETRCARAACGRTFAPGNAERRFCTARCRHLESDRRYQARLRRAACVSVRGPSPGVKRGGGRPRSKRGGECLNCGRRVPETSRFSRYCGNSCACLYGRKRRAKEQGVAVGRVAYAARTGGAA